MPLSVTIPRKVAIRNHRLALCHIVMVTGVFVILLFTHIIDPVGYVDSIPITTSVKISFDEPASIAAMEAHLSDNIVWEQNCASAEKNSFTAERWGQSWPVNASCVALCDLDEVLTQPIQTASESQVRGLCLADFKSYGLNYHYTALQFMETHGQRDIFMITSRTEFVLDHLHARRQAFLEYVPQAGAGIVDVGYDYKLERRPSWFPFSSQHDIPLSGSMGSSRTLILDAGGMPHGDLIHARQLMKLSLNEIWMWATGDDLASGEARTAARDFRQGAEIEIIGNCYGKDADLNAALQDGAAPNQEYTHRNYGATFQSPVCTLRFRAAGTKYTLSVQYGLPGVPAAIDETTEVITEVSAVYLKVAAGSGTFAVMDIHSLVITITSMLVLLVLPKKLTTILAARCLGPMSDMYRRSIIEPYDIEEHMAEITSILAANTHSFHSMCSKSSDGMDVIELQAIQSLLCKVLEYRTRALDEREIASLAYFVYSGICKKKVKAQAPSEEQPGFWDSLEDFSLRRICCGSLKEGPGNVNGITLDQWNQARLESEKITFDAMVALFDKDRPRWFCEDFFTPAGIRKTLLRARDDEPRRMQTHIGSASVKALDVVRNSISKAPLDRAGSDASSVYRRSGTEIVDELVNSGTLSSRFARIGSLSADGLENLRCELQRVSDLLSRGTRELIHEVGTARVAPSSDDACNSDPTLAVATETPAPGASGEMAMEPSAQDSRASPRGTDQPSHGSNWMEVRLLAVEASLRSLEKRTIENSHVQDLLTKAIIKSFPPDEGGSPQASSPCRLTLTQHGGLDSTRAGRRRQGLLHPSFGAMDSVIPGSRLCS